MNNAVYLIDQGLPNKKNFTSIDAYSPSFGLIISGNTLFSYSSNSSAYQSAQTLTGFNKFKIFSYSTRAIVYAENAVAFTTAGVTKYNISSILYFATFTTNYSSFSKYAFSSTNSPTSSAAVMVSPALSRVHVQLYSSGSLKNVFKSVDFSSKVVNDIEFKSESFFSQETAAVPAFSEANYHLGENYLAVRNDITSNSSSTFQESAYQFFGSTLMYMRSRTLSASEVAKNRKIYVDDYFSDNLLVLDLYYNGLDNNKGYDIYSFSYGNLASTIKVIPPVDPPYLTFTPSAFTSSLLLQDSYIWVYTNIGASSSTITVYQHDETADTHLSRGTSSTNTTAVSVLASSEKCLIVS